MKVNVEKNISKAYKDINVLINTPEDTNQVEELINVIIQMSAGKKQLIGIKDNKNYILQTDEIICFYSEEKSNYCRTKEGNFKVKEKLYELENTLGKEYIRISNSCIVNLKYIKAFDSNITGTIEVIFTDETKEYVSRRRVKEALKRLKEWGN